MDAVFPTVTDPAAGMVALDPLCNALFGSLNVEDAFAGLPEAIGTGCSVEEIFRQVPDGSGNLVKLLWFLEAAGLNQQVTFGQSDSNLNHLDTNGPLHELMA